MVDRVLILIAWKEDENGIAAVPKVGEDAEASFRPEPFRSLFCGCQAQERRGKRVLFKF